MLGKNLDVLVSEDYDHKFSTINNYYEMFNGQGFRGDHNVLSDGIKVVIIYRLEDEVC